MNNEHNILYATGYIVKLHNFNPSKVIPYYIPEPICAIQPFNFLLYKKSPYIRTGLKH